MIRRWTGLLVVLAWMAGCGGKEAPPTVAGSCPADQQLGDACVGVPAAPLCESDPCTSGACNQVTLVSNDAELNAAAAAASAGDCIALGPGSYSGLTLPDGVSLFGRAAGEVSIEGTLIVGGAGVRVRGVRVRGGGIQVTSGDAHIQGVRVENSPDTAVGAAAYATVSVDKSEVNGGGRYGVSGFEAKSISITDSVVAGGAGPAVWAQCGAADGCSCSEPVRVALENVRIQDNALVGAALVGASAELKNVLIAGTKVGPNFQAGGGLSVSGCSIVSAGGLVIADNSDFGLLIDDSSAEMDGIEVRGNLRGVWVQNIGTSLAGGVTLRNGVVADNRGVGLGVGSSSLDVEVGQLQIHDTQAIALPVLVGGISAGSQQVGDGLTWLENAQVALRGVMVQGSARASVLIDVAAGANSIIEDLTLAGGDEAKGVVLQSYAGGNQPVLSASPGLDVQSTEVFSVPSEVAIPPGI